MGSLFWSLVRHMNLSPFCVKASYYIYNKISSFLKWYMRYFIFFENLLFKNERKIFLSQLYFHFLFEVFLNPVQWFSAGAVLPPKANLETFLVIKAVGGLTSAMWCLEARDAAKYVTVHGIGSTRYLLSSSKYQ